MGCVGLYKKLFVFQNLEIAHSHLQRQQSAVMTAY